MGATAQATDLVLMTKPAYADKVPLFLGINNVKFRKKILPGDTLEIHTELLSERAKKAIATCKCAAYTAGDLAAENRSHHRHALRASFSPGVPGPSTFKKRPAV